MLKTIMEFSIKGQRETTFIKYYLTKVELWIILKVTMHPYGIFMTFYEQLPPKQHTTTFIVEVAPRISDSNFGPLLSLPSPYNEMQVQ